MGSPALHRLSGVQRAWGAWCAFLPHKSFRKSQLQEAAWSGQASWGLGTQALWLPQRGHLCVWGGGRSGGAREGERWRECPRKGA